MNRDNIGDAVNIAVITFSGVWSGLVIHDWYAGAAWIMALLWFAMFRWQRLLTEKWRKRAMAVLFAQETSDIHFI